MNNNTPDTEITLREALAKIEGLELALSELNKARSSRDTYWKERVEELPSIEILVNVYIRRDTLLDNLK